MGVFHPRFIAAIRCEERRSGYSGYSHDDDGSFHRAAVPLALCVCSQTFHFKAK